MGLPLVVVAISPFYKKKELFSKKVAKIRKAKDLCLFGILLQLLRSSVPLAEDRHVLCLMIGNTFASMKRCESRNFLRALLYKKLISAKGSSTAKLFVENEIGTYITFLGRCQLNV